MISMITHDFCGSPTFLQVNLPKLCQTFSFSETGNRCVHRTRCCASLTDLLLQYATDGVCMCAVSKVVRVEALAEGHPGSTHPASGTGSCGQLVGVANQPAPHHQHTQHQAQQQQRQQQTQLQVSEVQYPSLPFAASASHLGSAEVAGVDASGTDDRQKHAKALAYLESMLGVAQQQSQSQVSQHPHLLLPQDQA